MQQVKTIFLLFIVMIGICIAACKKPFNPPATNTSYNYLVVEGFINITDSTFIKLSRSVTISSAVNFMPELKANITIENNNGNSYPLAENGGGVYAAPSLNLSAGNQYRIRIKTSSGSQYLSDFAPVMISQPIDSVSWKATTDLKIYVSTHDANRTTGYYRWDFTEAWEFRSNFNTQWMSNGDSIVFRPPSLQIWDCFTGDTSSNIIVGTSAGLSKNVISQQLVNTIPANLEKIGFKYSIQVKQYSLTPDAYSYWQLLQKNTEQLGSIFDAQPSASIGNIHSVNNPDEPVIGYIGVGTTTTSRIFIAKTQLPNWTTTPKYNSLQCELDTIRLRKTIPDTPWQNEYINFKQPQFLGYLVLQIPVQPIYTSPNSTTIKYWLADYAICVDCTLRGKPTPPPFWK